MRPLTDDIDTAHVKTAKTAPFVLQQSGVPDERGKTEMGKVHSAYAGAENGSCSGKCWITASTRLADKDGIEPQNLPTHSHAARPTKTAGHMRRVVKEGPLCLAVLAHFVPSKTRLSRDHKELPGQKWCECRVVAQSVQR